MKKSSKILVFLFSALGILGLCLCGGAGVLLQRYLDGGVNPFLELRMATAGESIEIKEHFERDGRTNRQLLIDGIDHGGQFQLAGKRPAGQPNWPRVPTTYYHTQGPVGMAFSKFNWFPTRDIAWEAADVRMPASLVGAGGASAFGGPWTMLVAIWSEPPVGAIMMNNGSLAAYARPYQPFDFYERNTKVMQLSLRKPPESPSFTYIDDAKKRGAQVRVFPGNERQTFDEQAPSKFYHLLIVDTARGNPGLPAKDLLTTEAWQSYLNALAEDGVVCVHTSSRDFKLNEVVAATSSSLGLAHVSLNDTRGEPEVGHYTSDWVIVARKAEYLSYIHDAAALHAKLNPGKGALNVGHLPINRAAWTDAGANSLTPLRR